MAQSISYVPLMTHLSTQHSTLHILTDSPLMPHVKYSAQYSTHPH